MVGGVKGDSLMTAFAGPGIKLGKHRNWPVLGTAKFYLLYLETHVSIFPAKRAPSPVSHDTQATSGMC